MSSRRPAVCGNWKMFGTKKEVADFLAEVKQLTSQQFGRVDIGLFLSYTLLESAYKQTQALEVESYLSIGAQNVHESESGAFTGEISVPQLKDIKMLNSLVGHSERRQYYNESSESVALKAKALMANGLTPIICIGENLEERESGKTESVLKSQLEPVLEAIPKMDKFVVAYEPVWAIGTGKAATAQMAEDTHKLIRDCMSLAIGDELSNKIRILYGGSVKPENAQELFACENIDGGLVGGASLKADSFSKIIHAAGQS